MATQVAKHDGTDFFVVQFKDRSVTYYPVPGGVVATFVEDGIVSGAAIFIPMCRLVFEQAANGDVEKVRLESTMAQIMQGSLLAGLAAAQACSGEDG